MKPKAVLDALAVCLNNKTEFSGEVVKDSLATLMADDVPVFALMRTAILSGQSFPEVKRFVLGELLPHLIGKKVWNTAPKVWDGVIFAVKNFATMGSKNADFTLKALLSLPGAQLRAVMKSAPNVVGQLAKLLSLLDSGEERDAALKIGESGATDSEKLRLVKEIMSSVSA